MGDASDLVVPLQGALCAGWKRYEGDAVHNASLANLVLFGDVITANEAIARMEAGR
jgi:hypothetical protein